MSRRGTGLADRGCAHGRTAQVAKEISKHMKKFALLLSLVFVAGVAVADEAKRREPPKTPEQAAAAKTEAKADAAKPAAAAAEKGKTHEVTAEVVSVDAEKNTITIKGEKENKTVPVDAKAAAVQIGRASCRERVERCVVAG